MLLCLDDLCPHACCVAVSRTALAYQTYLAYQAGGSYDAFQLAQTNAAASLNVIIADLAQLIGPDSTALTSAASIADQVIAEQTAVPLPPPQVSPQPHSGVHCTRTTQLRRWVSAQITTAVLPQNEGAVTLLSPCALLFLNPELLTYTNYAV